MLTVTVSTCNYLSEYSTISGVGAGESYTATISGPNANPGYIVVYEGGPATNFIAQGSNPLTWTSTVTGTYYVHWLVDSTCATASGCHTTTLTEITVVVQIHLHVIMIRLQILMMVHVLILLILYKM